MDAPRYPARLAAAENLEIEAGNTLAAALRTGDAAVIASARTAYGAASDAADAVWWALAPTDRLALRAAGCARI